MEYTSWVSTARYTSDDVITDTLSKINNTNYSSKVDIDMLIKKYNAYKKWEDYEKNILVACDYINKYVSTDAIIFHKRGNIIYRITDEYTSSSKEYYILKQIDLRSINFDFNKIEDTFENVIDKRFGKLSFMKKLIKFDKDNKQTLTVIDDVNNPKESRKVIYLPEYESKINFDTSSGNYNIKTRDGKIIKVKSK